MQEYFTHQPQNCRSLRSRELPCFQALAPLFPGQYHSTNHSNQSILAIRLSRRVCPYYRRPPEYRYVLRVSSSIRMLTNLCGHLRQLLMSPCSITPAVRFSFLIRSSVYFSANQQSSHTDNGFPSDLRAPSLRFPQVTHMTNRYRKMQIAFPGLYLGSPGRGLIPQSIHHRRAACSPPLFFLLLIILSPKWARGRNLRQNLQVNKLWSSAYLVVSASRRSRWVGGRKISMKCLQEIRREMRLMGSRKSAMSRTSSVGRSLIVRGCDIVVDHNARWTLGL